VSELHDNLEAIVQDRAPLTTDTVLNLTTALSFTAEIEGNLDPFTVPEQWALDKRAKVRLHVTDDDEASEISLTDQVRFSRSGKMATFIIVDRVADPASPQTKFLAIEKLAGTKDE
jgi:hypothetical protein